MVNIHGYVVDLFVATPKNLIWHQSLSLNMALFPSCIDQAPAGVLVILYIVEKKAALFLTGPDTAYFIYLFIFLVIHAEMFLTKLQIPYLFW